MICHRVKTQSNLCCTRTTATFGIANEDDAVTTVVDVETHKVVVQINVGIEPEGMAVSPDGKTVITTSETTNMAHWIDVESHEIYANTLVDSRPRHAEFVKDGTELWVSSEIGGTISVFATEDQHETGKIRFEIKGVHPDLIQPVGFELTPGSQNCLYCAWPPRTTSLWSIPKPWRSRTTSLSGVGFGTWRLARITANCSRQTGSAAMSR